MSHDKTPWPLVNKTRPCAVCGKTDACKYSPDGEVAMCKRVSQGTFKESKGWYFHRLTDSLRSGSGDDCQPAQAKAQVSKSRKMYPDAQAAIDAVCNQIRDSIDEAATFGGGWSYHNPDGSEFARSIRFNLADGDKQFRPIHPYKGGWKIGDPVGLWPLYRRNELPPAGIVYVCEGEKTADAARKLGLAATTSAHGSSSAGKSDWTPLAGRDVVILPDNDEAGQKYAQDVARLLVKLDPPAKVRIVALPGLPSGGDVVEFVAARPGQSPEAVRGEIEALAAGAAAVDPADLIGGPVSVCLADVEATEVKWLWPGRMALGRLTLLAGMPGGGKSFCTLDFAARVSTGTPWPDSSECERGSVILVCGEDDPADTIKPRLEAHHADCRKVFHLAMVRRIRGEGKPIEAMFTLADMAALETELRKHPDCRLIVVDPLGSFLGGDTDAHRDNEVRGVLAPVAALAAKYGVAVLLVAHYRKSQGSIADDMVLGSRGITGICRAVWHLVPDPQDRNRRLLLPGKNNRAAMAQGLAFTIQGDPASVVWERELVDMSADDLLALAAQDSGGEESGGRGATRRGPQPKALAASMDWLRELLRSGPMRSGDPRKPEPGTIAQAAKDAEMRWSTVRRAREALGIKPYKGQFGDGWYWKLPPDEQNAANLLASAAAKDALAVGDGGPGEDAQVAGPTGHMDPQEKQLEHLGEKPEHLRGIELKNAVFGLPDAPGFAQGEHLGRQPLFDKDLRPLAGEDAQVSISVGEQAESGSPTVGPADGLERGETVNQK